MSREYREEQLTRVLREKVYDSVKGVQETVIVTDDGLVVAAYPGTDQTHHASDDTGNSHWVAALAAEIISQSRRALGRLGHGEVNRVLIEGESSSMIVIPAGDRAALAVMVDTNTKLGLAMFQIARVAEHIGGLLG